MKLHRVSALAMSGALVAIVLGLGWTISSQPTIASQASGTTAPPVPVAEVVVRRMAATARFTGHLEASHVVDIVPRVDGLLLSASVPEGGLVERGDVLFRIDPTPFAIRVAQARAGLDRAVALAEQAEREHARLALLSDSGTASRKALDAAMTDRARTAADVLAAKAALAEAELLNSYTEIRAPISGVADRIRIQPGNQVSAAQGDVLTRILSTEALFVTFHIDEASFARLGPRGLADLRVEVDVAAEHGDAREGVLDFGGAEFDRSTGTLRLRAVVDNRDGRLKPGMFVRVLLPLTEASDAVLVAESAIHTAPGGRYVLVTDGTGTVVQKPVQIGAAEDGLRVVTDGLTAGERVILKGLVQPGMVVDPQPVSMPATHAGRKGDAS